MNRRLFLIGLGSAAAGTVVIAGSGAYDRVASLRGADIAVGDRNSGFIVIEKPESVSPGTTELVSITNRFDETITVDIELQNAPSSGLSMATGQQTIAPGETKSFDVVVPSEPTGSVDFEIVATGSNVGLEAVRSVDIEVPVGIPIDYVTFTGQGNVNPIAADATDEVTVDVWYYDGWGLPGGGSDAYDVVCNETVSTNGPIQGDLPGGTTGIVALYIHEADQSFHHPEFDPDDRTLDSWAAGDGIEWEGAGGERNIGVLFDEQC